MHFSDTAKNNSSKFTKIAIVAALHVAVGAAVMNTMSSKTFTMPKLPTELVMFTPEAPPPPPPPPEPPKEVQKTVAPPKVIAPPVEVEVPQTQESPVLATVEADPVPAEPGPVAPEAPPSPPSANPGTMRTAALADANGCAKPDYPARAARNGDVGTVALALLIGTDGRVTDARVQKSSGSRELDSAAKAALSLCQFKPAMNNGVPEPAWGKIAYVWTLN